VAHTDDEVRTVMREPVVTLAPRATIREAATVLRCGDIGAAVVVDADSALRGVAAGE
jgi:CBS domain-containing protein